MRGGDAVRQYLAVLTLLGAVVVVVAGLYLAGRLLVARSEPLAAPPFLSGAAPAEHALSRFHVRWYAVTLIFLAFDMEMVFMYPWAVVFAEVGLKALIEMFLFLAILLVGVAYAWREGALRWT
ncbi:MAG TPA: NADH-quinone oxidoreductase subunit A [Actinomycetota bacterium]|nr:NADH-quinone oxidoreductase subunit A [Actinomycetota bacterium]